MRRKTEHKPVAYLLAYSLIKFALKIFFQKIDIRHGQNVPDGKPVVLVANHPNSIMDALVLGVVTKRRVNYIAHAGLFRNRVFGWFLRRCGVIPVYRRVDDPDKMDRNIGMFEACTNALENNEAIGIFPEGVSDMVRKVKQIKTGTARIVLESEQKNNFELGVVLIPVGLHFYSRSHFRSRVLVNFGEPLDLRPFFAAYKENEQDGVHRLTHGVQSAMEMLTVNIHTEELDTFVRKIEVIYKDELKTISPVDKVSQEKAFREDFVISRAIADCVTFYLKNKPERVSELQEMLAVYNRKLRRLHLRDAMLKETHSQKEIWRNVITAYLQASFGFLPAMYGVINNFIPYRIAEFCGRKFLYERTKILSALLIGGGLAFLFFYTLQTMLVYKFGGLMWAAFYFFSLPLLGFYALAYIAALREQKEKISFSFYLFTSKHLFNRMKRERRQLIAHLDKLRAEYEVHTSIESQKQAV
ncbi:MAG: lysophospholipid acyltransferase family protein [bacterium]